MYKEIMELENNISVTLEQVYKCLELYQFETAKTYLATLEILNEDYKDYIGEYCVEPSNILKLYERMWKYANTQ